MNRSLFPSTLLILALTACTQSAVQNPTQDANIEPAPPQKVVEQASGDSSSPETLQVATSSSSYGEPLTEVLEDEALEPAISPTPAAEPSMTVMDFESDDSSIIGAMGDSNEGAAGVAPTMDSSGLGGLIGAKGAQRDRSSSLGSRNNFSLRSSGSPPQRRQVIRSRGQAAPPAPHAPYFVNTESYTNYGVNDMTETSSDRFSTFAIDVDTASYTIARRKIQEGSLPPAAAVRVEEFINYFSYSYAPPETEAPFAVHMEAAPDPFNSGHHLFRVGVKAQEFDSSERKPVHLTFLVDVSGSMSRPDKLGLAKRSLRDLTNELEPGDTVALATYAGRVRAILDPTDVIHSSQIHAAIEDLSANGSTAMNSGIELAYRMAQSGFVSGHENRVIVLSDGDANVGPSSHQAILTTIQEYAQQGITLSTIGFGMGNYKDTMMEQLANQGDGNYYYIDSYNESKKVFGKDLAGTLQVVAKDVKIQVEFNPEAVKSYRLIGYENRDIADRDFRNDAVDAGEIGTGHTVTALYDLVLNDASNQDLATVRVRNKKPGPDSPAVEWMTAFHLDELHRDLQDASSDFRIAVTAATFAEVLRGSAYAADIQWAELSELASKSQRPGSAADDELLSLIQRAASLSGPRGATAER